mmetsp:Transcript_87038/g.244076  ORF Transcript_87038/g.244076 Transcript_87038/m.244076 type:complete len:232 (+) Transcript_87038:298-993(+)
MDSPVVPRNTIEIEDALRWVVGPACGAPEAKILGEAPQNLPIAVSDRDGLSVGDDLDNRSVPYVGKLYDHAVLQRDARADVFKAKPNDRFVGDSADVSFLLDEIDLRGDRRPLRNANAADHVRTDNDLPWHALSHECSVPLPQLREIGGGHRPTQGPVVERNFGIPGHGGRPVAAEIEELHRFGAVVVQFLVKPIRVAGGNGNFHLALQEILFHEADDQFTEELLVDGLVV